MKNEFLFNHRLSILISTCQRKEYPKVTKSTLSSTWPLLRMHLISSFLGQLQFYSKFLQNLSTDVEPLFRLTRKNIPWQWGAEEEAVFKQVKDLLWNDTLLTHFDQSLPIGISCDASNVGIGAVLFHRYPDGSERPIANVSKTLTLTQSNYSEIQRGALAMIFALSKFHLFLYRKLFIMVTDHKPLLSIFSPTKATPALAANRLARWALTLSQYDYVIKYRKTSEHGNVGVLSRLPNGPDKEFANVKTERTRVPFASLDPSALISSYSIPTF